MSKAQDAMRPRLAHMRALATSTSSPEATGRDALSTQPVIVQTPSLESTGFLGPTSYRYLLREGHATTELSPELGKHTIEPGQLELGSRILEFFCRESHLIKNLTEHLYGLSRMPIIPRTVMLPALDHLWDICDQQFIGDDAARLRMVVRIFENTYKPISTSNNMRAPELWQAVTGVNLRWELIGAVITLASLTMIHIPEHAVTLIDTQHRGKNELLSQALEITDHLSPLLDALPLVNELLVSLKYYQMLLAVTRFGDSSRRLYSSLGELCSCIYATGIHRNDVPREQSPVFVHQWRRTCLAVVYTMDKTIATALGRPPMMTRHYCSLEPPLDLDEDPDPAEHESNLRSIDEHGWNVDRRPRPATTIRLRLMLAKIREEVLELYLGVNNADLVRRAEEVFQRLAVMWDSCPSHMKYSAAMWNTPALMPTHQLLVLLTLNLDYLHSKFLLHRLISGDRSTEVFAVAQNILTTILVINDERERLRELRNDFTHIFLQYGLPSVQLICTELLHRSSASVNAAPGFSRAQLIRELTVYVSCLSWVARPGSGNYEFCKQVKARFTRILDEIIDPSHGTSRPPMAPSETASSLAGASDALNSLDPVHSFNTLLDWDIDSLWDPRLDIFCGSVF
ncbi:fungal specific transcription factor domain-containing protein [Aspergillus saccharolyticus JOP 1030-1]|uniref:Xylanolytic transcriptional activator regulatory domain-containing protein n=1 Tax=Aspergillus saccharolyticus JOP 1030-1 TaxID=1450539 RepID=A0A318ZBP8_9EURO|nr:hypothetical protein BP01DRAFT_384137 [Aspergillus saccharolyticus JOP 1030-1]PYH43754.1 hypothetical protein BP01DRAFT_384137 [Aspergillus saccharolyticus JOP 1030-1]